MTEQGEASEIPAVSISLETSESAETCREVFIEPDRSSRPLISRSLTLASQTSSSSRTRVTLPSSSRGSLVRTDNNGYGVGLSLSNVWGDVSFSGGWRFTSLVWFHLCFARPRPARLTPGGKYWDCFVADGEMGQSIGKVRG